MPQMSQTFAVGGGLDQVSPAFAVSPGRVRSCLNYEPLAEGYASVDGYERYDGRTAPSSARFWSMPFEAGQLAPAIGDVVLGVVSGAEATIVYAPHDVTGSWSGGTATGTLIVSGVSGTFTAGEGLTIAAAPFAEAVGAASRMKAPTRELADVWYDAAQDHYRTLIEALPGSGPVRGVFWLNGSVYAIRDNDDETAGMLWRATTAGWVAYSHARLLEFNSGSVEIIEGETLTGTLSGAHGTVARIVRNAGSWGATAPQSSGYMIITGQTGTFAAEQITSSGGGIAYAPGNSTVTALPAGGRWTFLSRNFFADTGRHRVYGACGEGNGFEFATSFVCPVRTGMDEDKPTHVAEIGNHLVLAFRGGSLQVSSDIDPILFDAVQGAAEFGVGGDITDVQQSNETALVIFTKTSISILSGVDIDTFNIETLTEDAGAEAWTAQKAGQTLYLDRRGLRTLAATSAFGNFKTGTLTELIEPLLRAKRAAGLLPRVSIVVKSKSHYRLIWQDGSGIAIYLGRKNPEILPFNLGGLIPHCALTCEMDDGTEGVFVGAEDGFVYRMDSGGSFDGAQITGHMMFPFNHLGSPTQNKRFHAFEVEVDSEAGTDLGFLATFDFAGSGLPKDSTNLVSMLETQGGGGVWNDAQWNDFYWSSAYEGRVSAHIDGIGQNISITVTPRRRTSERRHILKSVTIFYTPRGLNKERNQ